MHLCGVRELSFPVFRERALGIFRFLENATGFPERSWESIGFVCVADFVESCLFYVFFSIGSWFVFWSGTKTNLVFLKWCIVSSFKSCWIDLLSMCVGCEYSFCVFCGWVMRIFFSRKTKEISENVTFVCMVDLVYNVCFDVFCQRNNLSFMSFLSIYIFLV